MKAVTAAEVVAALTAEALGVVADFTVAVSAAVASMAVAVLMAEADITVGALIVVRVAIAAAGERVRDTGMDSDGPGDIRRRVGGWAGEEIGAPAATIRGDDLAVACAQQVSMKPFATASGIRSEARTRQPDRH